MSSFGSLRSAGGGSTASAAPTCNEPAREAIVARLVDVPGRVPEHVPDLIRSEGWILRHDPGSRRGDHRGCDVRAADRSVPVHVPVAVESWQHGGDDSHSRGSDVDRVGSDGERCRTAFRVHRGNRDDVWQRGRFVDALAGVQRTGRRDEHDAFPESGIECHVLREAGRAGLATHEREGVIHRVE